MKETSLGSLRLLTSLVSILVWHECGSMNGKFIVHDNNLGIRLHSSSYEPFGNSIFIK